MISNKYVLYPVKGESLRFVRGSDLNYYNFFKIKLILILNLSYLSPRIKKYENFQLNYFNNYYYYGGQFSEEVTGVYN